MMLRLSLAVLIGGSVACASAHPTIATQFPPVADSSIFAPLTLPPAPSATRLATGAPGPRYWQNAADYDLHATLDTTTGTVQGTMTLRYTNHSPNPLPVLWFQMEQNRYRTDSTPAFGYTIEHFTERLNGAPVAVALDPQTGDMRTELTATLPRPLQSGETATFDVAWHYIVPPVDDRMGRQGSLDMIAQWYPRVNVYDDVKGWNTEPFLGTGEFYLDYGDYTLTVTVPATYVVAATGTLDNPREVLTPTEIARLAQAMTADTVVHVISAEELTSGAARLKQDGMVTWKFHAQHVRDAVFAASPEYQWDATHWHGILAQAYYRPQATASWAEAAATARLSIEEYSERWYPYPYPQVSVAEGPISGGMEYPMISFDGAFGSPETEYFVLTHEIGHDWFPMIVGSNERVHAWMDEGFNTFINTFSVARRYPDKGDQTVRGDQEFAMVRRHIQRHGDLVMDVPADSAPDIQYVGYDKPAGVLQLLRRDVLGPTVFDKAFRLYIRRWAYKHPTPQDFFRTIDEASGQPLDWFWREWFYETPGFDQAIDSVAQTTTGQETHVTVVYGNRARGVLPLLVRFTFRDSSTKDVRYPADVWRATSTRYMASYTFPTPVVRIELDPEHQLVDTDRANNVWPAQPPATNAVTTP